MVGEKRLIRVWLQNREREMHFQLIINKKTVRLIMSNSWQKGVNSRRQGTVERHLFDAANRHGMKEQLLYASDSGGVRA